MSAGEKQSSETGRKSKEPSVADFVGAVDQGTTSTRFMVFDHSGAEIARHQLEHTQVLPRPGWVEHNPVEIWERTNAVIKTVLNTQNLKPADLDRDGAGDLIRHQAGLPPATYFSGGKLRWLLDHVDGLRADAERGEALFGTIDTWLLWNLTGGAEGGVHVTDVTNASRTMLMNLTTLD